MPSKPIAAADPLSFKRGFTDVGAGYDILEAVNADWDLDTGDWVQVQPGATLQRTGANTTSLDTLTVTIDGAEVELQMLNRPRPLGDGRICVSSGGKLSDAPAPAAGDAYDRFDFAYATGVFDELDPPTLTADTEWDASRLYTEVPLGVADGLPGEYKEDGVVDAADYVVWRNHLGQSAEALPNDLDGGLVVLAPAALGQC